MAGRRQPPNNPGGHDAASGARALPHDPNAERALLGAALNGRTALETLATRTRPEDFFDFRHQAIAAALTETYERNQPNDPVSVASVLIGHGRDDIPLPDLLDLQGNTPAISSAPRYAEIVHDHATRRRMIGAASQIADLGYEPGDVHDAVNRSHAVLSDVAANNGSRTYSTLDIPDLAPYVAGSVQLEQPELLTRTDGHSLIYPGKMHLLHAEPASGKGWVALLAAAQVLGIGGTVVYLDYEDTTGGIVNRLLALEADAGAIVERFRYIRPDGALGLAEKVELKALLDRMNPDLVIIDGVAEALARDGLDEDSNADVALWTEKYPRWIARTGAAVVLIDHVPKNKEKRSRGPRGAGHKLAAIDGASYEVIVTKPFSRQRPGEIILKIAKDRAGGVGAMHDTAGVIHITPSADGAIVRMRIEPPSPDMAYERRSRPTRAMEQVSRALEQSTVPLTAAQIKRIVRVKPSIAETAITLLISDGHLEEIRHGGPTVHLRSTRPFRADDDPGPTEPPEDTTPRDLTDEGLFADNPGLLPDELAERRNRKQQQDDQPE